MGQTNEFAASSLIVRQAASETGFMPVYYRSCKNSNLHSFSLKSTSEYNLNRTPVVHFTVRFFDGIPLVF